MIICDACDLGYHLQCLGDTDSANDLDFNILEDDWTCGACDASGDDSEANGSDDEGSCSDSSAQCMPVNKLATLQDAEAMLYAK